MDGRRRPQRCGPAHRGPLRQVVRSEDNGTESAPATMGRARLWEHGATDWRQQAVFFGHRGAVLLPASAAIAKAVLTGGADGTARIIPRRRGDERAGDPSGAGLHVEQCAGATASPLTILRSNQILTQWDAVSARETLRQSLCPRYGGAAGSGGRRTPCSGPNIGWTAMGTGVLENPAPRPESLRLKPGRTLGLELAGL